MRPLLACLFIATVASGGEPKPALRMQAVPLQRDEVSFQHDGEKIARLRFFGDQQRPFVFPIIGPSGRSITRMRHSRDPVMHGHMPTRSPTPVRLLTVHGAAGAKAIS